jgi:osmotically-inducible protein OsmY
VRIEVPRQPKNQMHAASAPEPVRPTVTVQQQTPERTSLTLSLPIQQSGGEMSTATDDETLQQLAAKRLSEDSEMASVSVSVSEARAVLTGTVSSAGAKANAEKLVKALRGVKSIDNRIVVSRQ